MTHPDHTDLPAFATRVLPVIALDDARQAVPLARALLAGGIDAMEITLRTAAAIGAIEAVAREVPAMVVGAGTVTQPSDVPRLIDAGARFALSPGCTDALVDAVRATGLPFVPGVMTPSEAMRARDAGFGLLKLFPARVAGGLAWLRAVRGPLPDLRFCPTGGLRPDDLQTYLAEPNVALVGGSWLTPADALAQGDWARITALAREATGGFASDAAGTIAA